MSWSYSGDPGASDRDAVRFAIGDTDSSDQQLSDDEVDYLVATKGTVSAASLSAVRHIIAKYSRLVDKAVGDLRISYSQRKDHYAALLKQIQKDSIFTGSGAIAPPYAGGISISDKDAVRANSDRVQPTFTKGLHDYQEDTEDPDDAEWKS